MRIWSNGKAGDYSNGAIGVSNGDEGWGHLGIDGKIHIVPAESQNDPEHCFRCRCYQKNNIHLYESKT